jgi:hypothetical protein
VARRVVLVDSDGAILRDETELQKPLVDRAKLLETSKYLLARSSGS